MKIHNTTDRSLRVSGVWIPAGQFRTVRDFDETEPRNARFLDEGFIALDAPEEFEPEPEQVLDSAIPLYLSSHLLYMLYEAQVSELYSRQNAMRNATENAENLIDEFTIEYNKARQASVTQEIIEIVNSAEALKG